MSCAENCEVCGAIIFRSTDENDLLALQRFVAAELIRFGRTSPLFHSSPENQAVFLLEKKGLYLKGGVPWVYPYEKVRSKFPNIRIKGFFPSANQDEWDSVTYGDTAPPDQFAKLEEMLIKDHFLPLKLSPTTTNVSVVLETEPSSSSDSGTNPEESIYESKANVGTEALAPEQGNGLSGDVPSIGIDTVSVEVDPQIERSEHIDKIKDLIRNGQEALALQLVRSLNDPQIYSELLRDCCELSDEDEGWIQVSELFKEHDALFYQLLANAPVEANLPGPLRLESIEDMHLNHCASLTDLDFLKHFIALKSFSIWGTSDDAVDLNDISGLEGVPRLKTLQLNGLKSSPDWTPLQHLVQLRELTLSGEQLTHPGPLVFSRLTKLKELSITCNGAVEMQGLSACKQLSSLTLNEAKSLGSLSFLESLHLLRCLRIDGYGGDSLKGIGKCRKITEFSISDAGKLEDISEVSSLSRLRDLSLSGRFQNLDPLKSLASLQTLYINDAKELRDVSGLSGCLGLERINLNGVSSLGSLWGIGQLKSLQELEVYSWESTSGYMDIHEVRELSNLRDLTISCSGRVLRGFPTVRHLEKLRSLDLSGCNCRGVTDLSPLRKLKLLNSLKMANCQSVTNLNGLSDLHCLETLELIDMPRLASLSGLREFDQLQQLTITGCTEIEGLDDLANLNSLTHLALRNFDKLCDASGIHGMTQLETLDLEGSERLSDISFLDSLENLNSLDLSCCNRIHPDDFVHLNEDDFETLYLPDVDEYEDEDNDDSEAEEEYGEDEGQETPWGERNLNDIPDDEWLRLYNKEQDSGLLQRAVGEGWLDRVPEYIGTRENLLAVEALHFAAQNRNFSQLPDSLLTVDNLLAEDADHHWNIFHFAAGYGSLDLLPDHLLVEKNLQVPTRVDCPLFDNIFAGSTCLHIAAAQGVLTLLPRSILTTQNLLLQDDRGNTPLDKAEEGLQALKDTIAELEENEAEQAKIDFHGDWLQTSQIQIDHLRQQVAEAEIPKETMTGEEPKGESTAPDKSGPSLLQEDIDTTDSSSPLIEQPESIEEDQQNGHNVYLFDDVMLDAETDSAETQNVLEAEPALEGIGAAFASNHIAGQKEAVCESQYTDQAVGVIEEVMSKGKREESPQMLSITELSLDDQPAPQKQKTTQKISVSSLSLDNQPVTQAEEAVAEEAVAEEAVAEEAVAEKAVAEKAVAEKAVAEEALAEEALAEEALVEEVVVEEVVVEEVAVEEAVVEEVVAAEPAIEEEISPLVMNTWFHSLDEAVDHPKAVVTLDIVHQESVDRLGVLSEFPYLEELHFIKVNIDNFKELIPVSKLCHIKFESCEVNGWVGLLDLPGLKKVGCYPGVPPEKVKQLLEESGVEIYLFTPTRINNSEASGAPESAPKTQVIYEEAIAS
jgi:hypothetical protein